MTWSRRNLGAAAASLMTVPSSPARPMHGDPFDRVAARAPEDPHALAGIQQDGAGRERQAREQSEAECCVHGRPASSGPPAARMTVPSRG